MTSRNSSKIDDSASSHKSGSRLSEYNPSARCAAISQVPPGKVHSAHTSAQCKQSGSASIAESHKFYAGTEVITVHQKAARNWMKGGTIGTQPKVRARGFCHQGGRSLEQIFR